MPPGRGKPWRLPRPARLGKPPAPVPGRVMPMPAKPGMPGNPRPCIFEAGAHTAQRLAGWPLGLGCAGAQGQLRPS